MEATKALDVLKYQWKRELPLALKGLERNQFSGNDWRQLLPKMCQTVVDQVAAVAKGHTLRGFEGAVTVSGDVSNDIQQLFPLIRRTYPNEIAFNLVSFQPMTRSTGRVYWWNDKYGQAYAATTPDAITAESRMDQYINFNYSGRLAGASCRQARKVKGDLSSVSIEAEHRKLMYSFEPEAIYPRGRREAPKGQSPLILVALFNTKE